MKILFSPSEAKKPTPNPLTSPINSIICDRDEILQKYYDLISSQDQSILGDIFGVKSANDIIKIKNLTMQKSYHKAVLMYDGVAYEALNYSNLDESSSRYIDENLLIFSNLYGVLRAGDYIQFYKLKQGEKISQIDSAKYYKPRLDKVLDEILEGEDILDLRAGYYDKFYGIKTPYITMKFLKNSKVVSHFAKYYRGLVLRDLALNKASNFDELMQIKFPNLSLLEIRKTKLKSELIFDINDDC
ncbi:YaaA family protein [Campylobacter vicugnae]|uniref:YaaA family protein n=1 Tax=Campylobacter vicugnae TaxID=1660076 RepID=UPI000A32E0F2|nr:YaaA family protein [Campylobacter sp. RM8970]